MAPDRSREPVPFGGPIRVYVAGPPAARVAPASTPVRMRISRLKSPLEHAATRPTLLAAAIAALVIGIRLLNAPDASAPPWDARPFDRPTNAVERVLLLHDGQTYAALAQDPTLSNPGLFYGDREEEAYRAGRPLLPWLAWAGSLGQPTAVPIALLGFSGARDRRNGRRSSVVGEPTRTRPFLRVVRARGARSHRDDGLHRPH